MLDIRRALRSYARSPGLTATLVLTVAVGAGSNAAIFAFIGGLVSQGLPGSEAADPSRFTRVAVLLLFACGLILVLACATVAGLLLSRASARMLETAVKVALGATRRRLARQCLIDSLLITLLGGAAGVLFAWWTTHLFPMLFFADDAAQLALTPNRAWLGAAAGAWIVVMAICGMVPVLAVPQRDPSLVLRRDASKSSNFARRFRTRLVVAQIAACTLLVVVAGVIREDLRATLRTSRGRVVDSLLVVDVGSPSPAYFDAVRKKASRLPGVTGVALVGTLPAGRAPVQEFSVERAEQDWREIRLDVAIFAPEGMSVDRLRVASGRMFGIRDGPDACRVALLNQAAADRDFEGDAVGRFLEQPDGQAVQIIGVLASPGHDAGARPLLYYYDNQPAPPDGAGRDRVFHAPRYRATSPGVAMAVDVTSPEYFDVFADPPTAGRAYDASDRPTGCRVALINEEGARTLFDDHAVGNAVIGPDGDRIEIVGVVGAQALGAAQKAVAPMLFLPQAQAAQRVMVLAIRAGDTSPAARASLRDELAQVGGGKLLTPVDTLEAHLERTSLAAERIATTLVGVCAGLALALSLAGVYAVMADLVVRRRRELALRIALGAAAWRLVGGIVREGLRLAAVGGVVGLAVSVIGAPLLDRVVVRPHLPGPLVLVSACAAVAVLVALACAAPAWRAVRVDPRVVMHEE